MSDINSKQVKLNTDSISFHAEGLTSKEVTSALNSLLRSFDTVSVVIRKCGGNSSE